MTHAKERLAICFTGLMIAAVSWTAAPGGVTAAAEAAGAKAAPPLEIRIQPARLLHASGAELYRELCASCHGGDGAGNGPAARALEVPPPALDSLRRAGVPRRHWTYVLEAPCEDSHHRAASGAETMPCWQRHFRHALGNDGSALLVSAKLVDHLDSIQR